MGAGDSVDEFRSKFCVLVFFILNNSFSPIKYYSEIKGILSRYFGPISDLLTNASSYIIFIYKIIYDLFAPGYYPS